MAVDTSGKVALTVAFEGNVQAIAFSPDGTRVAGGGDDTVVRVRTVGTGPILDIPSDGFVSSIAYSPDGTRLAIADLDQIYVRDATSGTVVWQGPIEPQHSVDHLAFTPDGATLVAATEEFLATFHATDGTAGPRIELGQQIAGLDVSRDGTRVAIALDQRHGGNHQNAGAAIVYDTATLTEVWRLVPDNAVYDVAFVPGGPSVLCGSADGSARMFDPVAKKELWNTPVEASHLAADGTGVWTVVGGSDDHARMLEVKSGVEKFRSTHDGAVTQVAFAPNGRWFASAGIDLVLHVVSVKTGKDLYMRTTLNEVAPMRFSPDSRWLGVGMFGQILVLDNGPVA
jgi:WD40 repeat protein